MIECRKYLLHTKRDDVAMSVNALKTNKTLNSIQAMRGIAAVLVMLFHFQWFFNFDSINIGTLLFSNGRIGVPVFFVISGFIMAYTTRRYGASEVARFVIKRLARVYPLYLIATLSFVALLNTTLPDATDINNINDLLRSLTFYPLRNNDAPYFGWATLPVGWTLNYEMFFYLVLAFSLFFGRLCWIVLGVVLSATLVAMPLLSAGFWSYIPEVNYNFTFAYLSMISNPIMLNFTAGVLCGLLLKQRTINISKKMSIALITISVSLYIYQYIANINPGWGFSQWGIGAAIIILLVVNHEHRFGLRVNKVLIYLGEISFSIYLNHIVMKEFLHMLGKYTKFDFLISGPICGAIIICLTLFVSGYTRKYIELGVPSAISGVFERLKMLAVKSA